MNDDGGYVMSLWLVGGGPTWVELCAEISVLFAQVCQIPDGAYQHLKNDVSVMLIHGGSDLLPGERWILIYVHVPCGGSIEYKIK